jgi:type I restriction enzyme S subunit
MSSKYPFVPLARGLDLYQEYIDNPEPLIYPKLSVKLYGRGVELNGSVDGMSLKMKRHQIAKAGQVILSEIWGKKGAIGIVPSEGNGALCTCHFFLFDIDLDILHPQYLQAIFTANYLEEQLNASAKGTTGYAAVRPKHLLAAQIPLPSLDEQRRIVARIEQLAAKIEEARGLRTQVEEDAHGLLLTEYHRIITGAQEFPMSCIAPLVRRPVDVELSDKYYELGIRSFGKGTFHKSPVTGAELGTKRIFRIEQNDLLFNIVFAWEGAVAVAQPEDHGRVGSHRFLTCVPGKGVVSSSFLGFHFLTERGLEQLLHASPGSAGRNRTLGLQALEQIMVPVPLYDHQLWFERLQSQLESASQIRRSNAGELVALLPSILDKAFKGEL